MVETILTFLFPAIFNEISPLDRNYEIFHHQSQICGVADDCVPILALLEANHPNESSRPLMKFMKELKYPL